MKYFNNKTRIPWLIVLLLLALALSASPTYAGCFEDDEYAEALKQTEDEWNAVQETMKQSSEKFKEFREKYQEYEDNIFSQDWEKGIRFVTRLFDLDPKDEALAKQKLKEVREGFNKLDAAGIKTKLDYVTDKLDRAVGISTEITNAYEFAKKFDPANAKDNPTYGLRMIGTILSESAGKVKSIPLVGQILGPWVEAYAEVAGDFANALDRLGKKIKDFRQDSLCAQLGTGTDAMAAFESAGKASSVWDGETCLTYFGTGAFKRMKGMAWEGNKTYFLFNPVGCLGYFSLKGNTDKVYRWHELLIKRRALEPDWLAGRANSLKPELEKTAIECYQKFASWDSRSHKGWIIIDKLGGSYADTVRTYARYGQETFVANFMLDERCKRNILAVITEYEKYTYIEGLVFGNDGTGNKGLSGASVDITMDGKSFSTTTSSGGDFELLMAAKHGSIKGKVTADGYEDHKIDGSIPDNVLLGMVISLGGEVQTFSISGRVVRAGATPTAPVAGATVTVSGGAKSGGAATTGADGAFTLSATAGAGTSLDLSAVAGDESGGETVVARGESIAGVVIGIGLDGGTGEGVPWDLNVTVLDSDGQPLPGAAVTGGGLSSATGGAGTTVLGPIAVKNHTKENPFSVTVSASVAAEGNQTIGASPATVTYTGEAASSVTLTVPVEQAAEVTISGRVLDANGVGVLGATISTDAGVSTSTGGDGGYSLPPVTVYVNTPINVSASYSDANNSFADGPKAVIYDGKTKRLSASFTLSMSQALSVNISGRVVDMRGEPLSGASVSLSTGQATSSGGDGSFTMPPVETELGVAVVVSASVTTYDGQSVGGQTTVIPRDVDCGGAVISIEVEQDPTVTITGTVTDTKGDGISGASVRAGGMSTTTGGGGSFTLPPFPSKDGTSVSVSATATDDDGNSHSGQGSVIPSTEDGTGSVSITIDMTAEPDEGEDEGDDEDVEDLIDELEEELGGGAGYDAALSAFQSMISSLDGIAGEFYSQIDYFDQRVRELREESCEASDVGYALNAADAQLTMYDVALSQLPGLYADVVATTPEDPDPGGFVSVEGELNRVVGQGDGMDGAYSASLGQYGAYECDKDASDADAGATADEDADPDDVGTGAEGGGGVEICGDGIDNNSNGEIDECSAGCCDKSVQITVSDCGNAADDVFQVAIDGSTVGVTPKGMYNTFNVKLDPGSHTVTITCLDDGGNPLGSDVGTACVTVVVYGADSPVGGAGSSPSIDYGASAEVSFEVPAGPGTPTAPPVVTGAMHKAQGLR